MKRPILFFFLLGFFIGCRRDTITTDDIRLLQTKTADPVNGKIYYYLFEYDAAGRITKLLSSVNNDVPVTVADISYNGNKVMIRLPEIHNSSIDYVDQIEYTADATNKPLQRVQNVFLEFKAPVHNPQRDFKTDTANYQYDAAGLVTITGNRRDSTWFNPGTVSTHTDFWQYSSSYNTAGGNLEKIIKTTLKNYRFITGSTTIITSKVTEENYVFEYNRAYFNRTDFTNALILTEFSVLYDDVYPLDKNYKNVPDKISYSRVTRDLATGAVIESDNSVQDVILDFNLHSFISGVSSGNGSHKRQLIYNH
jgi:hypothetical protein